MKKLLALILSMLLLMALTAFAAAENSLMDALMDEIEAEAEEDLKRSADQIYLLRGSMDDVFFTTSDENYLQGDEITNYTALKKAYGGEPTVTVTRTGGFFEFDVAVRVNPDLERCFIEARLVSDRWQEGQNLPRESAGEHFAEITITWGPLTRVLPIIATVYDCGMPTGLSGVPESVNLTVGEKWEVDVAPNPPDWAFDGLTLYSSVGFEDSSAYDDVETEWVDNRKISFWFTKPGSYDLTFSLLAWSTYNGTDRIAFTVSQDAHVEVADKPLENEFILRRDALSWTTYETAQDAHDHYIEILNGQNLREAYGGQMTASFRGTGGKIWFEANVESSSILFVSPRWEGMDDYWTMPADSAGTYEDVLTLTWGSARAEIPVRMTVLPYDGVPLGELGVGGVPDAIQLELGESWFVDVEPDPPDWSHPDIQLTANYHAPEDDPYSCIVNDLSSEWGDMSYKVVFRKCGEFRFGVSMQIYAETEDGYIALAYTVKYVKVTVTEGDTEELELLTVTETEAVHEISPDKKSIFIDKPTISGGVAPYTIAYNCYDADSNPVNYYYSNDARTAMTPGYNGRFNVFVVVRDSAGAQVQIDTGWLDLTGYEAQPLTVQEQVAVSEISPDGRSIFINRPTVSGGTGQYTYAYNCYDTDSNPVNYYYSDEWRTAMTPGYSGRFCVFVVVSDGEEQIIINTGWYDLGE
ncbi:MAG: hypothetical protein IKP40_06450 [Clostridia bacterium]|nr:hypothetical protein [Clostridia bacterium]